LPASYLLAYCQPGAYTSAFVRVAVIVFVIYYLGRLVTTSSNCANKTPRVTVTSANDELESPLRTTSLPMPDSQTVEDIFLRQSAKPVTFRMRLDSLPADVRNHPRVRSGRVKSISGHLTQDDIRRQTACVFDNRVYSPPESSSSSRCSDDDDDDDKTVTSPRLTCGR